MGVGTILPMCWVSILSRNTLSVAFGLHQDCAMSLIVLMMGTIGGWTIWYCGIIIVFLLCAWCMSLWPPECTGADGSGMWSEGHDTLLDNSYSGARSILFFMCDTWKWFIKKLCKCSWLLSCSRGILVNFQWSALYLQSNSNNNNKKLKNHKIRCCRV